MPSSGASFDDLTGVTGGLVLEPESIVVLFTDTGEITDFTNATEVTAAMGMRALRSRVAVWRAGLLPEGEVTVREPGQGVNAGIGFYVLDDEVSVLAVSGLKLGPDAVLLLTGSRGVVLLSAEDVNVQGIIDASAPCDEARSCPGPGGGRGAEEQQDEATGCAPGKNGEGSIASATRTGGGGGGFATDGAAGGTGGSGTAVGGAGGSLELGNCPGSSLQPLRGGGGAGAGSFDDSGGSGGGGGGAVQITSFTRIVLDAPASSVYLGIFANGAGGGGAIDGGGGGGGAGGAILLEAPEITADAVHVVANGGGGGGIAGSEHEDGEDGSRNGDVASGGVGDFNGGAGGTGLSAPGVGEGGGFNTGGGGGSVGIIRVHVAPGRFSGASAVFSPEPQVGEPRWIVGR